MESGAASGESLSNSLFFELHRSWSGLLIEPNTQYFLDILRIKRNAFSINCCLSTRNTTQKINFVPWKSGGGILDKYDALHLKWLKTQSSSRKSNNITAQCFTLYSLLLSLGRAHVDYWSLDVEGPELEILQTVPFGKITTDVISVEYKISGQDARESEQRSLTKLKQIRNFFKNLGNYNEVGILPWGSGINQDKKETKGLDVIFKRVKWNWGRPTG